MSRVLLIRHLPRSLSLHEKNELLLHFGAEKVWELRCNKDVVLASFPTHEVARASLARLHQLEIGKRRLVVEYSDENEQVKEKPSSKHTSVATENMKLFLKHLNAWNPSLDFFQPPTPNLRYKYPSASPTSLINIVIAMAKNKGLYIQVLHLMNKMSLESPFTPDEEAVNYFVELFKPYFAIEGVEPEEVDSEAESEISSGDEPKPVERAVSKIMKRKHILPQTRKRAAAVLSAATISQPKKKKVIDQKNIFEETNLQEPKKISLKVSQDTLSRPQAPDTQVIGEIKKLTKEPLTEEMRVDDEASTQTPNETSTTVSKEELLKNKVSFNDMKVLPVFKNYHPGEPSMRLYLKNLAKNVKEVDIKRIYGRYVDGLPNPEQQAFDVRVMQEGRMKGQGFVTFPSVETAEIALRETNGYFLNDKPMVVQFARVSNKKPIG